MSRSEMFVASAAAASRSFSWRVFNSVSEIFGHWLARRRLKDLTNLDDAVLRDIGVSRGDVFWAQRLSLTKDPLQDLSKVAKRRFR